VYREAYIRCGCNRDMGRERRKEKRALSARVSDMRVLSEEGKDK
jgi:hypothetical protein